MAAQGKQRSLAVFGILVAAALLIPSWCHMGKLQCHFCPLQTKEAPCFNLTTECSPGQHCATSRGFYGAYHALSQQGCVDRQLCDGAPRVVSYMGVEYRVRHECCCRDKCNMAPASESVLKMLLNIMAEKEEYAARVLRKRLWGSCEDDYNTPSPSASVS
ncbi:protein Bouncer-like [Corythoichthys intestinalis]|uniref:protein Bouncer-like n=1 Tax=Corythoichthys intestinalis TaxID=161448 RepID=UPI0025A61A99|nr:protein Bouncer-like [Corythoichthys intestinalis]